MPQSKTITTYKLTIEHDDTLPENEYFRTLGIVSREGETLENDLRMNLDDIFARLVSIEILPTPTPTLSAPPAPDASSSLA